MYFIENIIKTKEFKFNGKNYELLESKNFKNNTINSENVTIHFDQNAKLNSIIKNEKNKCCIFNDGIDNYYIVYHYVTGNLSFVKYEYYTKNIDFYFVFENEKEFEESFLYKNNDELDTSFLKKSNKEIHIYFKDIEGLHYSYVCIVMDKSKVKKMFIDGPTNEFELHSVNGNDYNYIANNGSKKLAINLDLENLSLNFKPLVDIKKEEEEGK